MIQAFDVVVLGGGSGAEALVRALAGRGPRVAVVEEHRVGGECPFTACVPSKVMLGDAKDGVSWADAVRRRDEKVSHLDDTGHARELARHGATLVRGRGRFDGWIVDDDHGRRGRVLVATADGGQVELTGEHLVLATGGGERWLDVPGIDLAPTWTPHDAWTTPTLPGSMLVVGVGAVGLEAATCFARFGSTVHLVDRNAQLLHRLPPAIGELVGERLDALGVVRHQAAEVASLEPVDRGTRVTLTTGATVEVDRVLLGIGKVPRTTDVGLPTLGVDPATMDVGTDGRVAGVDGLWAVGDVTGMPAFTHSANALAELVADNVLDGGVRRMDVAAIPMVMFTDPPVAQVGELRDDEHHVLVRAGYDELGRPFTDGLGPGTALLSARRGDGVVVGVAGVGEQLDEVCNLWALAVHAAYDVERLATVQQQFPTVGEVTRLLAQRARDALR